MAIKKTNKAPRRSPDPSRSEVAQRSAEIRRRWSAATEQDRRVEKVEPIVYFPVADDWLPADSWDQVAR